MMQGGMGAVAAFAMLVLAAGAARGAGDCGPVKAAMLAAAQKPHSSTIVGVRNGKPIEGHMIQTADHRYVERGGQWYSMPFGPQELADMKARLDASNVTCERAGTEQVDGRAATVYSVHVVNDDLASDHRLWIGADGLPIKTQTNVDGGGYATTLDFTRAEAPAGAKPAPGTK